MDEEERYYTMVERLIIGLGAGRCGTTSLARLFREQNDTKSTHECALLPHKYSEQKFRGYMRKLHDRECRISVDVSLWALPYVKEIHKRYPATKFVCLKRDPTAIKTSFLAKAANRNHWTDRNSKHWKKRFRYDPTYSPCYPKYDLPKEEALEQYIKDYYGFCRFYEATMGDAFRIFDIEMLNTYEGVGEILSFAGYTQKVLKVGIKANRLEVTQRN